MQIDETFIQIKTLFDIYSAYIKADDYKRKSADLKITINIFNKEYQISNKEEIKKIVLDHFEHVSLQNRNKKEEKREKKNPILIFVITLILITVAILLLIIPSILFFLFKIISIIHLIVFIFLAILLIAIAIFINIKREKKTGKIKEENNDLFLTPTLDKYYTEYDLLKENNTNKLKALDIIKVSLETMRLNFNSKIDLPYKDDYKTILQNLYLIYCPKSDIDTKEEYIPANEIDNYQLEKIIKDNFSYDYFEDITLQDRYNYYGRVINFDFKKLYNIIKINQNCIDTPLDIFSSKHLIDLIKEIK